MREVDVKGCLRELDMLIDVKAAYYTAKCNQDAIAVMIDAEHGGMGGAAAQLCPYELAQIFYVVDYEKTDVDTLYRLYGAMKDSPARMVVCGTVDYNYFPVNLMRLAIRNGNELNRVTVVDGASVFVEKHTTLPCKNVHTYERLVYGFDTYSNIEPVSALLETKGLPLQLFSDGLYLDGRRITRPLPPCQGTWQEQLLRAVAALNEYSQEHDVLDTI